ncbi:MAG: acetyl-CoA carboxylase biotin carboxylase subunit [Ruminococcus sp.]|jgi:acetyl-CoA carboxylase biotin carboxylase subunit|nr:acetyl-CoA carboxylase biotin carboxylase subunit [Ruminococcus sp.]
MFKRILVANRGEIAVRIIRACREMNIETVAVYSDADKGALFTCLASRAVCIGGARSDESYLNVNNLISTALLCECDAIHPGYGFLSENADFARLVTESGLVFIGPPAEVISAMGDKSTAKRIMKEGGVPVVPGSDGLVSNIDEAKKIAEEVGYPVFVKATAGGGGRGMCLVHTPEQLEPSFQSASEEAKMFFGNGGVYIEKLIEEPRHIEVQILADNYGNVIHLGERDCTMQRRNQKMLEESPASILTENSRSELCKAAVNAAKQAGYRGAGTVEFVLGKDGKFYFIEMNTRLQVEHPVTEMVTGIDIVRAQIQIASGQPLKFKQEDVVLRGHAIECRINAEDPANGFCPCPGTVQDIHLPGGYGLRIDTGIYSGSEISPYYDAMVAKVIVYGNTRGEAIRRMRRALEECIISGIKTNIPLLYMLFYNPDYISNNISTSFIQNNLDNMLDAIKESEIK